MQANKNIFLFSVDLEDIRFRMKDGTRFSERVPANTLAYLNFLKKHHSKATFFTVGDIARAYPDLIKEIVKQGHEIACHSDRHVPLNKQTREEFKRDLSNNIESLLKSGASNISGYRAPVFSLTEKTSWAYQVIKECGLKYSSSVLPAANPLYGWKNFGTDKKTIDGITELPMTLTSAFGKLLPAGGGVYFRCLPFAIIKKIFSDTFRNNQPVLGYFHPYDIDTEQERFMHPDIEKNYIYNFILYFNRANTFKRLEKIMKQDIRIMRYDEYLGF